MRKYLDVKDLNDLCIKDYTKDFFDVSDFVLCPDGTPGMIRVLMKDIAKVDRKDGQKEFKLESLERLSEDTQQYFKDTLNQILFDGDVLKFDVLEKLRETAKLFIDEVEQGEFKLGVVDIILVGSNASYNYSDLSDIDLHIVYNSDEFGSNNKFFISQYFDSFRSLFNLTHKIFIKNCKVEVYLEDWVNKGVYNGIYSILHNQWTQYPSKQEIIIDTKAVDAKFESYKNSVTNLTSLPGNYHEALSLYKNIFRLRRNSLRDGGEFCTENLAFKKLRNEGFIDTLRDYIRSEKDKDLSIESLEESFRTAILEELT